mgnify:CR=1 FL=1
MLQNTRNTSWFVLKVLPLRIVHDFTVKVCFWKDVFWAGSGLLCAEKVVMNAQRVLYRCRIARLLDWWGFQSRWSNSYARNPISIVQHCGVVTAQSCSILMQNPNISIVEAEFYCCIKNLTYVFGSFVTHYFEPVSTVFFKFNYDMYLWQKCFES